MRDLEDQIHQAECEKLKITKRKVTRKGQAKKVLDDTSKVEKSKEVLTQRLHIVIIFRYFYSLYLKSTDSLSGVMITWLVQSGVKYI